MKIFIKSLGLLLFLTISTTRLFSQCDNSTITINILTDNYAGETSWVLVDENGTTVANHSYNFSDDNLFFSYDICVDDGCYTFTIFDSWGDGICCTYGVGSYEVIVQGETSAEGGAFNYQDSADFCAYSAGCLETSACNYNPLASTPDISLCDFPVFGYDCDGQCTADIDGDGICNMFEIDGCTDEFACNFEDAATDDNGTCGYANFDVDCSENSLLPHFNNAPEDINVSCSNVPGSPTIYASISSYASDYESNHNPDGNCYAGSWTVSVVMDQTMIEGSCPGDYTLIRNWVGTDCMGRQVEHTQTITVADTSPPSFSFGTEPITISCPTQPAFTNPIALDACSSPVTYEFEDESTLEGLCGGEYSVYRLVTATDACGNSSTVEQVIEVIDNTPPDWTDLIPEQVISTSINTEDFGMPSAEDLCSNILVEVNSELTPGVCPLAVMLTRTFIAVDGCGNESVPFTQVIYEDTDLLTFVESSTDANCSYSNDGSVNIVTSGAVPPYDIYFGSNNPDSLYAGDYTVTVSDDNLCTTTLEFYIFSPPALQLSLESTPPNCTSQVSGIISAFSAGGVGDLNYIWNGIDPLAVSGGDYTVGVEDENGCSMYSDIFVPYADIPVQGELEGAIEVMAGDSTVYEYTYTTGSSYEWTFQGANPLVVSNIFAISLLWATEGEGFVCVQETNAYGCLGEPVCLDINVSVGVDDLSSQDKILAYPNPTSGKFYCTLPQSSVTELTNWNLIDLSGSIIQQGTLSSSTNNTHTFDFTGTARGSYLLQIGSASISVHIF